MARRGFALIETLVIMGIVALRMALLIPAVQATRTAASATECRKQFAAVDSCRRSLCVARKIVLARR